MAYAVTLGLCGVWSARSIAGTDIYLPGRVPHAQETKPNVTSGAYKFKNLFIS